MRKIIFTSLCVFALVAAGVLLLAPSVVAAGRGQPKVLICHHGIDEVTGLPTSQIIEVSNQAVESHIAKHGDTVVEPESCDGIDNDCNGEIDDGVECWTYLYCQCVGLPGTPPPIGTLDFCFEQQDLCPQAASECESECLSRGATGSWVIECDYHAAPCNIDPGP